MSENTILKILRAEYKLVINLQRTRLVKKNENEPNETEDLPSKHAKTITKQVPR
jgi:hypothetical protein